MPEGFLLTKAQRRAIRERAEGRCEYCQSPASFSTEPFTVEYISPKRQGGPTTLDNLAFACTGCNGHKAAKTHALDPDSDAEAIAMPRSNLDKDSYDTLMSAYDDVMNADPASSKIGLHAILIGVLNKLGYRVRSVKAQELLERGYENQT